MLEIGFYLVGLEIPVRQNVFERFAKYGIDENKWSATFYLNKGGVSGYDRFIIERCTRYNIEEFKKDPVHCILYHKKTQTRIRVSSKDIQFENIDKKRFAMCIEPIQSFFGFRDSAVIDKIVNCMFENDYKFFEDSADAHLKRVNEIFYEDFLFDYEKNKSNFYRILENDIAVFHRKKKIKNYKIRYYENWGLCVEFYDENGCHEIGRHYPLCNYWVNNVSKHLHNNLQMYMNARKNLVK
jgi:hypothetical protein